MAQGPQAIHRSSLKASLSFRLVAGFLAVAAAGFALVTLAGRAGEPVAFVKPVVATAQVTDDPDDPAIWVNRSDPARSLIFGTNKVKAPTGALVAFGLDGAIRQVFAGLMVAMNSAPKIFLLYRWDAIAEAGRPTLKMR